MLMIGLSFALALMTAQVAVVVHLTRDDTIVLAVDFDTTPLGPYTRAAFDADWKNVRWVSGLDEGAAARADIVATPDADSGRCLCVHYPKGTVGPHDQAIQFMVELPKDRRFERATLRYRVRFGPGFRFVRGGKLPGLVGGAANTGGRRPDHAEGWSARMMWGPGGEARFYTYHADQLGKYGDDMAWSRGGQRRFTPGTWHTLEHYVAMNRTGARDGRLEGRWDGELAVERRGLRFRVDPDVAIDALAFSTFFGGHDPTWATERDETICFDDFIVTSPR